MSLFRSVFWGDFLKNMALLLFSLGLCLIIAEVAIRKVAPEDPRYERLADTPCLSTGAGNPHPHNAMGFHAENYETAKMSGVFRIVVLGDSQTFGAVIDFRDTYPSWLGTRLKERGYTNIEVLNFGVPGTSTGDQLCLAEHFVAQFDPDLVLLGVFPANDVRENKPDEPWLFYRYDWVRPAWIPEGTNARLPAWQKAMFRFHLFRKTVRRLDKEQAPDSRFRGTGATALLHMMDRLVMSREQGLISSEVFRQSVLMLYNAVNTGQLEEYELYPTVLEAEFEAYNQGALMLNSLSDRCKEALLTHLHERIGRLPQWHRVSNPFTALWSEMSFSQSYLSSDTWMKKEWEQTLLYMEGIRRELERQGRPWAVFLIPARGQIDPFYRILIEWYLLPESSTHRVDWDASHQRLRKWFEDEGVPVFDGLPWIIEAVTDETAPSLFMKFDTHYSPEGNKLWGGALADFLEREGMLSSRDAKDGEAVN